MRPMLVIACMLQGNTRSTSWLLPLQQGIESAVGASDASRWLVCPSCLRVRPRYRVDPVPDFEERASTSPPRGQSAPMTVVCEP